MVHTWDYSAPMCAAQSAWPNQDEVEFVLAVLEEAFKSCRFSVQDDWNTYSNFEISLASLDFQSSPGLPYCREFTTIGQWLKFDGISCDPFQKQALYYDVCRVFDSSFPLEIRSFIKAEPHKLSKAERKRWRLILALPLCYQVAWRMSLGFVSDLFVSNVSSIPLQHAMIPFQGGWKDFLRCWQARGYNCGKDMEAWDWTMGWFHFDIILQLVYRLCRRGNPDWVRVVHLLFSKLFGPGWTLVLSDGSMWEKEFYGMNVTGGFWTIVVNGIGQLIDHVLTCKRAGLSIYPLPVCCGDDELKRSDQFSQVEYERLGLRPKPLVGCLEFVGHTWTENGPIPCYFLKHLKKFMYIEDKDRETFLDAMCRLYCHSDCYYFWQFVASEVGVNVFSKPYYLHWYDMPALQSYTLNSLKF